MKKVLAVFMCVLMMFSFATLAVSAKSADTVAASSSSVLKDDSTSDEGTVKVVQLFEYIFSLVDWSSFIGILTSTIATLLAMFSGTSTTAAAA